MSAEVAALSTIVQVKRALGNIGQPPSEGNDVKGEETDSLVTTVGGSLIAMVCVGAIVSGALSMVMTASVLVDVASITLFALAPYAVYQKYQLAELGGMRGQMNDLRQSTNEFKAENDKLTANVDALEASAAGLKEVGQQYEEIVKKSQGQVDRLVAIVKENGEIQKQIKKNLQAQVMQNAMGTILDSDRNQDFILNKGELKRLALNLSTIPGVELDKENWKKFCEEKNYHVELGDVFTIFRNLKDDKIAEEDNIFHLKPDASGKKDNFLFG